MEKQTHLNLRIGVGTLQKLRYVSEYEGLSATAQIVSLVNGCIREFEEREGPIEVSE